jgi:hypothetical protein
MTKITNEVLSERIKSLHETANKIENHLGKMNGQLVINTAFINKMRGGLKVAASSGIIIVVFTFISSLL